MTRVLKKITKYTSPLLFAYRSRTFRLYFKKKVGITRRFELRAMKTNTETNVKSMQMFKMMVIILCESQNQSMFSKVQIRNNFLQKKTLFKLNNCLVLCN